MASDEDYMAFLDKANRDPSEGYASAQSKSKSPFKAMDGGATVPEAIAKVLKGSGKGLVYTSDADEPFEPVVLAWDEAGKTLPDEEDFAKLIHHPDPAKAEVEIMDPTDWDGQGAYGEVLEAVELASKGSDVRVYKVGRDGTRSEYWVVGCEGTGKKARLVGVKALAVES